LFAARICFLLDLLEQPLQPAITVKKGGLVAMLDPVQSYNRKLSDEAKQLVEEAL
jgi:hypothetical protein